jgi:hypothetical protein
VSFQDTPHTYSLGEYCAFEGATGEKWGIPCIAKG